MRTSQSAPAKNGSVAPSALAPVPSPPATMPSPPALPAPAPESPLLFAPAPVAPLPLLPHPMRSDDTARTGSTIVRCSEKAATPSRNPRKTPFSAPCVGRYTTAMACHVESQAGSAASAVAPTPATTSASAWADAPPHSSIVTAVATAGGGAHSTHAQAENGTSPPSGSATGARAPGALRYVAAAAAAGRSSAPAGARRRSGAKVGSLSAPPGSTAISKAATPSALEPERKKAVSEGGDAGAQPAEGEMKEAPAAHGAHTTPASV